MSSRTVGHERTAAARGHRCPSGVAVLLLAALAGCGGGGSESAPGGTVSAPLAAIGFAPAAALRAEHADADGSTFYRGADNAARLSGPVVGSGERPSSALVTPIPFMIDSVGDGLSALAAYRIDQASFDRIVLVVRSDASRYRCGAALVDVRLFDAAGTVLADDGFVATEDDREVYVTGDAGGLPGRTTITCLEPGTSAFLSVLIRSGEVADVEAIAAGSLSFRFEPADAPVAAADLEVVPLDYTVNDEGAVRIRIVNRRASDARVKSANVFVLDDAGHPVGVRRLGFDEVVIAPGEERVLRSAAPFGFEGAGTTLRVVLDVEPAGG